MTIFYLELFSRKAARKNHCPTANLKKEDYKLIPLMVFMWKSIINQNRFCMMNIGFNPTVSEKKISIEIHFDFDADLYDHKITVSILKYLRPEQKIRFR
jgi:riboflavin kinase/FMN adenylyltransferase